MSRPLFRVGLNPEEGSSFPYLLEIQGGVNLKAPRALALLLARLLPVWGLG